MITEDHFLGIIRDELGLPLTSGDLDPDFDQVVRWDSMQMLRLVVALERETGCRVPVGRLLEERSLRGIYDRVVHALAATD